MPEHATARRRSKVETVAHDFALSHRLALLLAFECIFLFLLVPFLIGQPRSLIGSAFALMLLAGIGVLVRHVRIGRFLALAALLLAPAQLWWGFMPGPLTDLLHPLTVLLFVAMLTGALAVIVFKTGEIDLDRVLGAVILYLNIGLAFACIYALIEQMAPSAFQFPQPQPERPVSTFYFLYFSFVTLTTVGFGDTVPLHPLARSLATLEAAIGQLYPAIILARLVSLEVGRHATRS